MKKDIKWECGDKEQKALDKLRRKLCSTPVWTYLKPGRQLLVDTEVLKYVYSGFVSQQDEDKKVVTYSLSFEDNDASRMQL